MLQNKLLFNQSSVSFEIIGLPDYSNDENKEQISIISQWKLMIIDKPLIEGNFEHLSSIMEAFYNYSNFLINNEIAFYQSNLIDIRLDNFLTHNILLKSAKKDVKPLNIIIGNSVLSDIINCFDQFNSSNKVRNVNLKLLKNNQKKSLLKLFNKSKISSILFPPLISIFSLFIFSSIYFYLYDADGYKEKNVLLNSLKISHSINSINTIL